MLSDFPDKQIQPPSPKDARPLNEVTKGFPGQGGSAKPPIQTRIEHWIQGLGLSSTAATALTLEFCEKVKEKARKEGKRKIGITYELGYENSYLKITVSKTRKHDSESLMQSFLFEHEIRGSWSITGKTSGAGTWTYTCKPQPNARSKKGKEEAVLNAVENLSLKQAEQMLEELLKIMNQK